MIPALLFASLILSLVGVLLPTPLFLALGGTSLIALLTALVKRMPVVLLIVFWSWMVVVLVSLVLFSSHSSLSAALHMLIGVWLVPVLLWPLGFAYFFDDWRKP